MPEYADVRVSQSWMKLIQSRTLEAATVFVEPAPFVTSCPSQSVLGTAQSQLPYWRGELEPYPPKTAYGRSHHGLKRERIPIATARDYCVRTQVAPTPRRYVVRFRSEYDTNLAYCGLGEVGAVGLGHMWCSVRSSVHELTRDLAVRTKSRRTAQRYFLQLRD
jgi:hypothetical protein